MTHHWSRFDRLERLVKRARSLLLKLNRHSDHLIANGVERSADAEHHYRCAKRFIADSNKELLHRKKAAPREKGG